MAKFSFIEADFSQRPKHGQMVAGDVFLCQRIKEEARVVAVLSDGLGSGIKANVLATLTATMAVKYASGFVDIRQSAETIMNTLPICSVRKMSYSTFTIVDIAGKGETRIIEYDNPSCLLIRDGCVAPLEKSPISLDRRQNRILRYSQFRAQLGDRIVFFSDGVNQAGMGDYRTPLGWGMENAAQFLTRTIEGYPDISARELAQRTVEQASAIDLGLPKDDITCGVIYFREPRRLLLITGPPFAMNRDGELASMVDDFNGRRVIAGGTTANIIARRLNRTLRTNLEETDPEIPPTAFMQGVDLVTEGTITLGRVAHLLESGANLSKMRPNAATQLASMLLNSDVVQFVVGTRINQAHQDPTIPVELDLRRNIVKRIAAALENRYVKTIYIQYI